MLCGYRRDTCRQSAARNIANGEPICVIATNAAQILEGMQAPRIACSRPHAMSENRDDSQVPAHDDLGMPWLARLKKCRGHAGHAKIAIARCTATGDRLTEANNTTPASKPLGGQQKDFLLGDERRAAAHRATTADLITSMQRPPSWKTQECRRNRNECRWRLRP